MVPPRFILIKVGILRVHFLLIYLLTLGVWKSHTTLYHPQGDGMVEHFNRILLQLLRSCVSSQSDWKTYLPYVLYTYRTSCHSTTGVCPYLLLCGRDLPTYQPTKQIAHDSLSYPAQIQDRLAELQDLFVLTQHKQLKNQKSAYYQHTCIMFFKQGDSVWLSIPTAQKLDPQQEGEWVVKSVKGTVDIEICDGK